MPEEKPPEPKPNAKPRRKRALPVVTQNRLLAALIAILTLLVFTSLGILTALALTGREPPHTSQTRLTEICDFIIKVSLGALVGLLGGRAAAPDRMELADR